jgi:hypothetical protein
MVKDITERRGSQRFPLHLPIQFRIAQKGVTSRWGSGVTCDISALGLSFRCRRPLPLGAHIEILIDWPARHDGVYPVDLRATGFIIRTGPKVAVRMTSHSLRVDTAQAQPIGATA